MSDKTVNKKDKIFPPYRDKSDSGNHLHNTIHVRLGDDINSTSDSSLQKQENYLPPFIDPEWTSLVNDNNHPVSKPSFNNSHHHMKSSLKSSYKSSNFWVEDPKTLFQSFDIIPQDDMNNAERLNAMTRIIIIITAMMFVIRFSLWWLFLVIGLIVVIILWYMVKSYEDIYIHRQREYLRRPRGSIIHPANNIIRPVNNIIHPVNNIIHPVNNIIHPVNNRTMYHKMRYRFPTQRQNDDSFQHNHPLNIISL